ncbi:MAG: hypothetical protein WAO91_02665 [Candidatus Nitrosotenuis sp.]
MKDSYVIAAVVAGFVAITSFAVLTYFQNPQYGQNMAMGCSFATDTLLNYLRYPQCAKPLGVGVVKNYPCAFQINRAGYVKVECEEPQKAWVENGCLHIGVPGNVTYAACP